MPSDKQANKPSVEITFPAVSELETKLKKLEESQQVLDQFFHWARVREELREFLRGFRSGTDAFTEDISSFVLLSVAGLFIFGWLWGALFIGVLAVMIAKCSHMLNMYRAKKKVSRDLQALQALQLKVDSLKYRVADLAVIFGEHSDSVLSSRPQESKLSHLHKIQERKAVSHGLKIRRTLPELITKQRQIHSTLLPAMLVSLKQAKTEKEALVHLVDWLECPNDGVMQAIVKSFVDDEIARAISMEAKGEHNQVLYFAYLLSNCTKYNEQIEYKCYAIFGQFVFRLTLRAGRNTVQSVKILNDTSLTQPPFNIDLQESGNERTVVTYENFMRTDEDEESTNPEENIQQNSKFT